jgi:excisionase family DNA binding protein
MMSKPQQPSQTNLLTDGFVSVVVAALKTPEVMQALRAAFPELIAKAHPDGNDSLTVKQVAEMLNCSYDWVYRNWQKEFPEAGRRQGTRTLRFSRTAINKYISNRNNLLS